MVLMVVPRVFLKMKRLKVNGRLFQGDVEELLNTLRDQVGPLVVGDDQILRTVSHPDKSTQRFTPENLCCAT